MRNAMRLLGVVLLLCAVTTASADSIVALSSGSNLSERAGQNVSTYQVTSLPYARIGAAAGGLYVLSGQNFTFDLAQVLLGSTAQARSKGDIRFVVAATTDYALFGGFSSIGCTAIRAALQLQDVTAGQVLYDKLATGGPGQPLSFSSASAGVNGALVPGHTYQLRYSLEGVSTAAVGGAAFGSVRMALGAATVVPLPTSILAGTTLLAGLVVVRQIRRRVAA